MALSWKLLRRLVSLLNVSVSRLQPSSACKQSQTIDILSSLQLEVEIKKDALKLDFILVLKCMNSSPSH